jgi:hypothetical protein
MRGGGDLEHASGARDGWRYDRTDGGSARWVRSEGVEAGLLLGPLLRYPLVGALRFCGRMK